MSDTNTATDRSVLSKFTKVMTGKGAFVRSYARGQEAMALAAETLWNELCHYDNARLSSFNDAYPGLIEFVNDWAGTQYCARILESDNE